MSIQSKLYRFVSAYNFDKLSTDENLQAVFALHPGIILTSVRNQYSYKEHYVTAQHQRLLPKDISYDSPFKDFLNYPPLEPIDESLENSLKSFCRECRNRDIIPMVYICMSTIPKGLIDKCPEFEKYLTRDRNGNPLPQAMYHMNSYLNKSRKQGCFNNPHWIKHLKAECRYAIELGFEGIFFDNPVWFHCQCGYCQEKFNEYTRLHRRTDIPQDIPVESDWSSKLWHAYTYFISRSLQDAISDISVDAKSLYDKCLISMNTSPPTIHPPSSRLLPSKYVNGSVDFIFYEGAPMARRNDRSYVHNISSYSYADAEALPSQVVATLNYGTSGDKQTHCNLLKLGIAEAACFRHSFIVPASTWVEDFPALKELKDYFEFLEERSEIYTGSELYGDIGVFFSYRTLFWNISQRQSKEYTDFSPKRGRNNGYPEYKAFCEFLSERHLFYKTYVDLESVNTPLLILPDCTNLEEKETAFLADYVRNGGTLIVSGETQLSEVSGKGRVIRFPFRLEEADESQKSLVDEVLRGIRPEGPVATIDASPNILTTLFSTEDRFVLNLANYDIDAAGNLNPSRDIRITLNEGWRITGVSSPDGAVSVSTVTDNVYDISALQIYSIVSIERN